jgi:hypothetical protein
MPLPAILTLDRNRKKLRKKQAFCFCPCFRVVETDEKECVVTNVSALAAKLKNKGFMVKEQEEGAYLLVHPSRGKYDWEADELQYRSVILDGKTGRIVSSGWPKFFNQGEWPDFDSAIAAELESGQAVITHKHDGSLIIRSVLPDGRIFFRTRDSFDGGKFAPLAEAVTRAKYPALLDPTVWPHGSLLFEYVGTGNQIVVRYEGDDDLVLLAPASTATIPSPICVTRSWARVASTHDLHLVETYDWASGAVSDILQMVQEWNTAEGVVVRSGDGQTLLKVKSAGISLSTRFAGTSSSAVSRVLYRRRHYRRADVYGEADGERLGLRNRCHGSRLFPRVYGPACRDGADQGEGSGFSRGIRGGDGRDLRRRTGAPEGVRDPRTRT